MSDNLQNSFSSIDYFRTIYPDLKTDADGKAVAEYDSDSEEYNVLFNGAGLIDLQGCSQIEMVGGESLEYLNRISTNQLNDVVAGSFEPTVFTNEKGRVIDRALVINKGDRLLLLGSGVYSNKLLSWLRKYIIMENIKVNDVAGKYSIFELKGSQSKSYLMMIFGDAIERMEPGWLNDVEIDHHVFTIMKKIEFETEKYMIISSPEDTQWMLNFLFDHKSVFDFRPVGTKACELYRVTCGIPAAPGELNDMVNPYEAGIIKDVSFSKGCYIGQEVIARLDTYDKVQRKLIKVDFENAVQLKLPAVLSDSNENEVGTVTSLAEVPGTGKSAALAIVRKLNAEEGTEFFVTDTAGRKQKAAAGSFRVKK